MSPAFRKNLPRLVAPLLLLAAGLAHAQWSWIDEKGIRQLSDRPPPPGTPPSKILKSPGKPATAAPAPAAAPEITPAPAGKEQADYRPLADREADFRREMGAMTAKGAQDDAKRDRARQRYCEQASRYKDWLSSGAPVQQHDANGARHELSKEERAREVASADAILASDRCR